MLLLAMTATAIPANAATREEICGEYDCSYTDELLGYKQTISVTIDLGRIPKAVVVEGLYSSFMFTADFDATNQTIALRPKQLSAADYLNMEFVKIVWDENNEMEVVPGESLVGKIINDEIVFEENEGYGIGIPTDDQWITIARNVKFSPRTDKTFKYDEKDWTEIGTAILGEVWLSYKILGSEEPALTKVKVAKNNKNDRLIALINPYKQSMWEATNRDSNAEGHIIIDISDPTCVIMEPYVYSGYTHAEHGPIYAYNYEGFYARIQNMDNESVKSMMTGQGYENTYLEDNQIVMPKTAIFATEKKPTAIFGFNNMDSTIDLDDDVMKALNLGSGIDAIENEGASDAVRYFNLQGVEVSEPQNGVYIEVRGNKAVKKINN